jgi:predicted transcriptional regulator
MQDNPNNQATEFLDLASDIVSAYVAKNSVSAADLPGLIRSVHSALTKLSKPPTTAEEPATPPVPIKSTIRPDYIISLEDGRRYKSMRRHLAARGLTPEQYRAKWGLRPDYPMVAQNYSKARSELAKALGLGQLRRGRSGKSARRKAARA